MAVWVIREIRYYGFVGKNAGGPSTGSGEAAFTHGLRFGGPAIDAIPAASCTLTTDQRGEPRPVDGDLDDTADCDIGAYELTPTFIYLPLVLKNH